jgi:hypothetical protein
MLAGSIFAQKNEEMEIYTFQQYKSEHTNPEKNKTTVLVSGTQGDEVVNVKMVTTPLGIMELHLNDNQISTDEISNYQVLTDFILDYAEMPRQMVAKEETRIEKPSKEVGDKDDINGAIIAEMMKDELITEETNVYDILIAYDKMFFNGKKQSDEMAKRYRALYERISGKTLKPTTYFNMSQSL